MGAVVEVVASGVPAGLGEPIYDKLDADLAKAMMSINAVKGVEIGDGFATAALRGEDNADEIRMGNDGPRFLSNHAGGILGGISSGQDIVVRFAVKPTSSILTPRRTIDRHGNETEIVTKGRHDPCVGIRAVPVGEAMMACVLADHLLRHRGIYGAALSQSRVQGGQEGRQAALRRPGRADAGPVQASRFSVAAIPAPCTARARPRAAMTTPSTATARPRCRRSSSAGVALDLVPVAGLDRRLDGVAAEDQVVVADRACRQQRLGFVHGRVALGRRCRRSRRSGRGSPGR